MGWRMRIKRYAGPGDGSGLFSSCLARFVVAGVIFGGGGLLAAEEMLWMCAVETPLGRKTQPTSLFAHSACYSLVERRLGRRRVHVCTAQTSGVGAPILLSCLIDFLLGWQALCWLRVVKELRGCFLLGVRCVVTAADAACRTCFATMRSTHLFMLQAHVNGVCTTTANQLAAACRTPTRLLYYNCINLRTLLPCLRAVVCDTTTTMRCGPCTLIY